MLSERPNILLIMVDDVGWFDVGVYHPGLMGCPTRTGSPLRGSYSPTPTPSELHGREGGVHYRTAPDAYRFDRHRSAHTGKSMSHRGTSSSTTANSTCSPCATTTGKCTSRSRMSGSPGALLRPTIPRPVNLRDDTFEQHMDAPPTRSTPARSFGPCCRPQPSSSSMRRHSQTSRPRRHRPTSTHKRSSMSHSRPPGNRATSRRP
jgi:hypothetical protein